MNNPRKYLYLCTRPLLLVPLLVLAASPFADAQATLPDAPKPQPDVTLRDTPRNLLRDQAAIWTGPAHVHIKDLDWMVPLAAVTGLTIATDRSAMMHVVSKDPNFNRTSTNASNALIGGFIAAPVAMFGWGEFRKDPRARETGILSGEAMIDSVVVEQGLKLVSWRERPAADNAKGKFFQSAAGIDSSFPSSHSVVAWSAAAVLAGEYPSRLNQILIYSAATGVSLTRVMGQQHFPTDVIVGSAAGWLVGRCVFRKHHKAALDDAEQY